MAVDAIAGEGQLSAVIESRLHLVFSASQQVNIIMDLEAAQPKSADNVVEMAESLVEQVPATEGLLSGDADMSTTDTEKATKREDADMEDVTRQDSANEPPVTNGIIEMDLKGEMTDVETGAAVLEAVNDPAGPGTEQAMDDFVISGSTRVVLSREGLESEKNEAGKDEFVGLEEGEEVEEKPTFVVDTKREEINLSLSYRRADEEDVPLVDAGKASSSSSLSSSSSSSSDSSSSDSSSEDDSDEEVGDAEEEEEGEPETMPDSDYDSQASDSDDDILPSQKLTIEEREKLLREMDEMENEDGPAGEVLRTKNELAVGINDCFPRGQRA